MRTVIGVGIALLAITGLAHSGVSVNAAGVLALLVILGCGGFWLEMRSARGLPDTAVDRRLGALPGWFETVALCLAGLVPYVVAGGISGDQSLWPFMAAVAGQAAFVVGYLSWLSWQSRRYAG